MNGIDTGSNIAATWKIVAVYSDATIFDLSKWRAGDRRSHSHAFNDTCSEIYAFVKEGTTPDIGDSGESVSDFLDNFLVGQRVATEVEKAGG